MNDGKAKYILSLSRPNIRIAKAFRPINLTIFMLESLEKLIDSYAIDTFNVSATVMSNQKISSEMSVMSEFFCRILQNVRHFYAKTSEMSEIRTSGNFVGPLVK